MSERCKQTRKWPSTLRVNFISFLPKVNWSQARRHHRPLAAQWVETVWNWHVHFKEISHFSMNSRASEWSEQCRGSKWVSAAHRAVRANERADEQMSQNFTHPFHSLSTHRALALSGADHVSSASSSKTRSILAIRCIWYASKRRHNRPADRCTLRRARNPQSAHSMPTMV